MVVCKKLLLWLTSSQKDLLCGSEKFKQIVSVTILNVYVNFLDFIYSSLSLDD